MRNKNPMLKRAPRHVRKCVTCNLVPGHVPQATTLDTRQNGDADADALLEKQDGGIQASSTWPYL